MPVDPAWIGQQTGLVLDSSHMAGKICWLKRDRPDAAACRT